MPFTRKFLLALGIEAEKVDEIIAQHVETTEALKEEARKYKEAAEQLPAIQKELDSLRKQNKAAEDSGAEYDKLKKEFDDFKQSVAAEKAKAAKEAAYKALLKDAHLSEKGIEKALKYAQWDSIELGEDGKIKEASSHLKGVREEWAEYVEKTDTKGAETATPPAGAGAVNPPSRAAAAASRYYSQIYGDINGGTNKTGGEAK